jgi:hypothetical protein
MKADGEVETHFAHYMFGSDDVATCERFLEYTDLLLYRESISSSSNVHPGPKSLY